MATAFQSHVPLELASFLDSRRPTKYLGTHVRAFKTNVPTNGMQAEVLEKHLRDYYVAEEKSMKESKIHDDASAVTHWEAIVKGVGRTYSIEQHQSLYNTIMEFFNPDACADWPDGEAKHEELALGYGCLPSLLPSVAAAMYYRAIKQQMSDAADTALLNLLVILRLLARRFHKDTEIEQLANDAVRMIQLGFCGIKCTDPDGNMLPLNRLHSRMSDCAMPPVDWYLVRFLYHYFGDTVSQTRIRPENLLTITLSIVVDGKEAKPETIPLYSFQTCGSFFSWICINSAFEDYTPHANHQACTFFLDKAAEFFPPSELFSRQDIHDHLAVKRLSLPDFVCCSEGQRVMFMPRHNCERPNDSRKLGELWCGWLRLLDFDDAKEHREVNPLFLSAFVHTVDLVSVIPVGALPDIWHKGFSMLSSRSKASTLLHDAYFRAHVVERVSNIVVIDLAPLAQQDKLKHSREVHVITNLLLHTPPAIKKDEETMERYIGFGGWDDLAVDGRHVHGAQKYDACVLLSRMAWKGMREEGQHELKALFDKWTEKVQKYGLFGKVDGQKTHGWIAPRPLLGHKGESPIAQIIKRASEKYSPLWTPKT